jgi:RND family efflux transporter MFP subunit
MSLLAVLTLVSGCSRAPENKPAAEKPRPVGITVVASRDLPVVVSAVGRLVPNREVVLSAEVSGIVETYAVDMGDAAAADQLLVKLAPRDYELSLQEAEANLLSARARLAAARNAFKRAEALLPDSVITQEVYEKVEAEYIASRGAVSQAEALVDIRRRNLDKTVIAAPFDGFVTRRMVELGQNINIGDPVIAMADLQPMRVAIFVNEQDYVYLDDDDAVEIRVEAYPERRFAGQVDRIGVKADPQTNTFEVEILVDNPDVRLKAGLTASVHIVVDAIPEAIMIPQDSVLFRENRREVFVVTEENRAAAREVTLGRVEGSLVRILQGLAPGDRLVTTGAPYLKEGDRVTIAGNA